MVSFLRDAAAGDRVLPLVWFLVYQRFLLVRLLGWGRGGPRLARRLRQPLYDELVEFQLLTGSNGAISADPGL